MTVVECDGTSIESLQAYECPEWFRDAKFGIYLHWGAYSVVERGEWYARKLYEEGSEDYEYHLKHYGHPSEFGYKDFIPMWKAEKFDPDALAGGSLVLAQSGNDPATGRKRLNTAPYGGGPIRDVFVRSVTIEAG